MRPIILRGVDAGVKIHSHRAGTLDNATIDWFLAALSLNPWMGRLFDRRVNSENAF
jgi:hypothetical protein